MKLRLALVAVLVFLQGIPAALADCAGVTVERGDTLYQIAKANSVTIADLITLNGISNPSRLLVGQCLRVTQPLVPHTPTRVTVDGVLDFAIVPQPKDDQSWLPDTPDEVTVWQPPYISALVISAHNHLAGWSFFNLEQFDTVRVEWADGDETTYQLISWGRYLVYLDTLIDIETNRAYPTWAIEMKFFDGAYDIVFYTCLSNSTNPQWGRMFWAGYEVK